MTLDSRTSSTWCIHNSELIKMYAAYEGCSGFPWASTIKASGISGAISSKGRPKVSSTSWEILLTLVLFGRANESPHHIFISASNPFCFLIYDSLTSSSCVNFHIVCRGTICPFYFRTHSAISFPSFLADPRQRPRTCKRNGNLPVVSRKYTHSY